jgi:hypothetical protein
MASRLRYNNHWAVILTRVISLSFAAAAVI